MILTQMMPMAKPITGGAATVTITISADIQNFNAYNNRISSQHGAAVTVTGTYAAGTSTVSIIINTGVYVGSSSIATAGFIVDNSWAAGDVLTIINNGYILGKGGTGGGLDNINSAILVPEGGGPALTVQRAVTINNNGTIGGGGGGGNYGTASAAKTIYILQGSGGAGYSPGGIINLLTGLILGTPGTRLAGGISPYYGDANGGGAAGNGGNLGQPGTYSYNVPSGSSQYSPSGYPYNYTGPGGYCTTLGSIANITWTNTGTRLGTLG